MRGGALYAWTTPLTAVDYCNRNALITLILTTITVIVLLLSINASAALRGVLGGAAGPVIALMRP